MADWTLITTTLGAAFLTGTFAYRAGRWQGRIALRRLDLDNRRLTLEQRATATQERRRLYTDLVNKASDHELDRRAARADIGADDMRELRRLLNAAILGAPPDVRDAAERLKEQVDEAEVARLAGDPMAYHPDQWSAALRALVEAMRKDVVADV